MKRSPRDWVVVLSERLRRVERREAREFRRWVEQTSSLLHLSVLLFLPLLIGLVTAISNRVGSLSFLLFPPLASGTYTLFANPEGRYASPVRFVTGLTVGALCGWVALTLGGGPPPASGGGFIHVDAFDAAVAVFLTGAATWALDVEEASAFSTALLGLLVRPGQELAFVVSVLLASGIVAAVFWVWRERFYERRAEFLYESTHGDDHVLVPMRGENPDATAMFGARLAAAHEAGKVVLLDVVEDADVAAAERELLDDRRRSGAAVATDGGRRDDGGDATDDRQADGGVDGENADDDAIDEMAEHRAVSEAATRLEMRAGDIETQVGVPCEVVVAVSGRSQAATVLRTAREVNCDLVAASYEQRHGGLSPYVRELFGGETDVVVHRSHAGRTRWKRVLVPVRRASDVAHSMLDFAQRLAGRSGHVSVGTCVGDGERERRRAEEMLADLVEAFDGDFETRVSRQPIERFLTHNGSQFDLVIMGASRDRSAASRFISPPTFERIQDVEADVAIVDRN
jgi:hypothetical protein